MNEDVEQVIDNIGVGEWQSGLANAVNDTYSYAHNSLFYALVPTYYRDYALRYVKVACEWLDGYVPTIHNAASGIIATRVGSKLITGLTKQIVGEKLLFKLNDRDSKDHETLHKVGEWASEQNIIKSVYAAIGFALAIGTSLIKANIKNKNKIWWEAVRFDNCTFLSSFSGEIYDATFMIRSYADTREGKSHQQFYLVEHRFFKTYEKPELLKKADGTIVVLHKKGEKVPMVEYKAHRVNGTVNTNMMSAGVNKTSCNWSELPKEIQRMIKKDYGALRLDEPQELGLMNLGVEVLANGEIDLSVPTAYNFGESMLVGIQDDMLTYELATSYLIRDMYLGKGTVYQPKSLSMADANSMLMGSNPMRDSVLGGIGDKKIELMKGVDPNTQKVIVEQFQIRAAEWQSIKENSLRNIAVKWGMSPKILSSFLATGAAQMTATQIDSEDDMSIAFIYHTRAYFKNSLNKLLETTLNFMGIETNLTIDFASPSLINKDRLLDRVIRQREAGFIDTEEAIRTLNPDLEEEAIQRKIDKALEFEQQMQMAQINEMNDDGTFGPDNNYDDLGGANLDGTTLPIQ